MSNSSKRNYKEDKIMEVKPIPRRIAKIINSQLEESVCKIYINEESRGTGFLCKIPFPDEFRLLPTLITNNHVIDEEYFQNNEIIKISFEDDKSTKTLEIGAKRKFYSNETYDISIIEIFPKEDNLKHFLEFDHYYDKNEKEEEQNIYLLHYPNGNESSISYGKIIKIKEYEIEHTCSTEKGSSGGPIISLETNKVIGVHKGSGRKKEENNFATLLKYPINEFIEEKNEIIIKLKIEKEDINKDVYILNYPYYTNSDGIRHEADELKEMNKENTLMLIDNREVEYEKYQKFDKIGIYEIKIKLKKNLKNAYCMFLGCKNIIDINLSKFKTEYINNMSAMFRDCNKLTNINLSSFDTKNVTNMNAMFSGTYNLANINLSSFDTKNVTNMACMFDGCKKLTNINLSSSFDTKNVTNMTAMFRDCNNLTNINLSFFDTKNVKDMCGMFYRCNNLTNINLSSFDTKNVVNMCGIFYGCNNLTNINLSSSFDTKNVTNMCAMFRDCKNLTNINLSSFDTKNVANMNAMFYGCNNLTNLDLSSFETKNVKDMSCMFDGCNKLTNINLSSSFDTRNVTKMACMFYDCNELTNINLSSFNTKNVTDMNGMFYDCKNLTNINFSSFDTKNVADMSCMFYGCENLTTIDLSYFESEHLISFKNIFFNCFKLIEIRISRPFSQIIKQEIKENIHSIFI